MKIDLKSILIFFLITCCNISPKTIPRGPKTSPRGSQVAPRDPPDPPKRLQEEPKKPQKESKRPQDVAPNDPQNIRRPQDLGAAEVPD